MTAITNLELAIIFSVNGGVNTCENHICAESLLEKVLKMALSPIFPGARKEISSDSASTQKLGEGRGAVDSLKGLVQSYQISQPRFCGLLT